MNFNFLIIAIAAIVPILTGFIWYNPKVFGTAWMNSAGLTEEQLKASNMGKILLAAFVMSFFLAFSLQFMVIHQFSVYSVLANEPGINDPTSEMGMWLKEFMGKYGNNFRTFKHGALHGTISGFFFAMPLIGINAVFERKGFKYIAIHTAYWMLTMAIMGGIICAFA
jgi:hypothetical protein